VWKIEAAGNPRNRRLHNVLGIRGKLLMGRDFYNRTRIGAIRTGDARFRDF
jgi:hypothetical protein